MQKKGRRGSSSGNDSKKNDQWTGNSYWAETNHLSNSHHLSKSQSGASLQQNQAENQLELGVNYSGYEGYPFNEVYEAYGDYDYFRGKAWR